jgi:hypothetical protein
MIGKTSEDTSPFVLKHLTISDCSTTENMYYIGTVPEEELSIKQNTPKMKDLHIQCYTVN